MKKAEAIHDIRENLAARNEKKEKANELEKEEEQEACLQEGNSIQELTEVNFKKKDAEDQTGKDSRKIEVEVQADEYVAESLISVAVQPSENSVNTTKSFEMNIIDTGVICDLPIALSMAFAQTDIENEMTKELLEQAEAGQVVLNLMKVDRRKDVESLLEDFTQERIDKVDKNSINLSLTDLNDEILTEETKMSPRRVVFDTSRPTYATDVGCSKDFQQSTTVLFAHQQERISTYYNVEPFVSTGEKEQQFPEVEISRPPVTEEPYNVRTGLMDDGKRRVDYVLVLDVTQPTEVLNAQLQYLVSLVKIGLVVEFEQAEVFENRHLQFAKIHAPNKLLEEYAEAFNLRKMFRNIHIPYIHSFKGSLRYQQHCYRRERECLMKLREHYEEPHHLSSLDRSYVVYLLLRSLRFGDASNHYGLHRLLENNIIVDAYALHEGPYFSPPQKLYTDFNCRQILYMHWAGVANLCKYQPLNLVSEYYGSKLAFFFAFYEFYNRALAVASVWGILMTLIYINKHKEYFEPIRSYLMKLAKNPVHYQGFECVGVGRDQRCPLSYLKDLLVDLNILKYVESPYIVVYTVGMSMWATLFLLFWTRVEYYWRWMWEDINQPPHRVIRTEATMNLKFSPNIAPEKRQRAVNCCSACCRCFIAHGLMPLMGFLMIFVLMCLFIFGYVELLRPLNTQLVTKYSTDSDLDPYSLPPEGANFSESGNEWQIVNRKLDFLILASAVFAFSIVLYLFEMMFNYMSYCATLLENHKTYERLEEKVIIQWVSFSFVYGLALVVYFTYLKGLLVIAPIEVTDMIVNLSMPWNNYSVNVTDISPGLRNITLRLLSWSCPGPLSCFREAAIVYLVVMIFRSFILPLCSTIWRMLMVCIKQMQSSDLSENVSTVEREYLLTPAVTDKQVTDDFNKLVLQFALICLFTPLFPLAPIIAFVCNLFDLRVKAKYYVTDCRRALLMRTRGIGYWNTIIKIICCIAPLCHILIVSQTNIFKRYVHYKRDRYGEQPVKSHDWLLGATFMDLKKYSVNATPSQFYWDGLFNFTNMLSGVHTDVILRDYSLHLNSTLSYEWPFARECMEDNRTLSYYTASYYKIRYMKIVCGLIYVHAFALIAIMLRGRNGSLPEDIHRLVMRERKLRKERLYRVPPPIVHTGYEKLRVPHGKGELHHEKKEVPHGKEEPHGKEKEYHGKGEVSHGKVEEPHRKGEVRHGKEEELRVKEKEYYGREEVHHGKGEVHHGKEERLYEKEGPYKKDEVTHGKEDVTHVKEEGPHGKGEVPHGKGGVPRDKQEVLGGKEEVLQGKKDGPQRKEEVIHGKQEEHHGYEGLYKKEEVPHGKEQVPREKEEVSHGNREVRRENEGLYGKEVVHQRNKEVPQGKVEMIYGKKEVPLGNEEGFHGKGQVPKT